MSDNDKFQNVDESTAIDPHKKNDDDPSSTHENAEHIKDGPDKVKRSPLVNDLKWGRVVVEGFGIFKDVKLYPDGKYHRINPPDFLDRYSSLVIGAEPWDWTKTNTHHQPGIQPADVSELLNHGCEFIILSRGMKEMLHTSDETLQLLKNKHMEYNKDYFILQSEKAMELYNEHVKRRKRVGALIHSTC